MKKYEYRIVSTVRRSSLAKKLNSLGRKGWKVANFSFSFIGYAALLEREIYQRQPTPVRQADKLRTIPVTDVSEDDNCLYIGD